MNLFFASFAEFMWGPWLLVLLLGAGFWLSVCLRGIQFRGLLYAFRLTFTKERKGKGDISHFRALMTALAATVGTGNIAGVSTAVALGGPGAHLLDVGHRTGRDGHQVLGKFSRG